MELSEKNIEAWTSRNDNIIVLNHIETRTALTCTASADPSIHPQLLVGGEI